MGDNQVTVCGNLTDDPELRFTGSGLAVASFTIAVNRRAKDQSGEWVDKLDGFFRCTAWRDLAENIIESLTKGARVVVVGRIERKTWTDQAGESKSDVEIEVDDVGPSLRWATASVLDTDREGS